MALVGWRVALVIVAAAAPLVLAYQPSFPYAELFSSWYSGVPYWITAWANFDGVHYYTIATAGYQGTGLIQAFFPVYPLLIKALHALGLPVIWAALLISHLSFWAALLTLNRLIRLDFSADIANWSLVFVLLFPTSFFFGSFYTESLFLFFSLQSLYHARQQRWWLAGLTAAVASATRIVGIALVPALLVELLVQQQLVPAAGYRWNLTGADLTSKLTNLAHHHWRQLLWIAIGSLGLISYMLFLLFKFNDPLYFASVQEEFGGGRQLGFVTYPRVVWRYIKILITGSVSGLKLWSTLQEFIAAIGVVAMLAWSAVNVRWSYITFSLIAALLPTTTGTFSSMPRYVLVAFPIYITLAVVTNHRPVWRWTLLLISGLLLIVNTLLFSQGYWVA